LPTPDWLLIRRREALDGAAQRVQDRLGLPAVLKPLDQGSSVDVSIVDTFEQLVAGLADLLARYGCCLAEKFMAGREITVGILGYGDRLRALPVLELAPRKRFYDYEAKYTKGMTELICPARLSAEDTERAQQVALAAHEALGCHGRRHELRRADPGNSA
jgi:D-alanine-D-alanine ligase